RELPACGGLVVRGGWRSAFAEDLGGDPLRHLAHRAAVAEETGSALDVDEPRGDDEPTHVETLLGRESAKRTGRADSGDAVAADGNVAEEPGGASSVDDMAIFE